MLDVLQGCINTGTKNASLLNTDRTVKQISSIAHLRTVFIGMRYRAALLRCNFLVALNVVQISFQLNSVDLVKYVTALTILRAVP